MTPCTFDKWKSELKLRAVNKYNRAKLFPSLISEEIKYNLWHDSYAQGLQYHNNAILEANNTILESDDLYWTFLFQLDILNFFTKMKKMIKF